MQEPVVPAPHGWPARRPPDVPSRLHLRRYRRSHPDRQERHSLYMDPELPVHRGRQRGAGSAAASLGGDKG